MKKCICLIILFFVFYVWPTYLYSQPNNLTKIDSALSHIANNKKLYTTKWLELVNYKGAGYKQILDKGFHYKVSDTLSQRSINWFYDIVVNLKDSIYGCDGKLVYQDIDLLCERFKYEASSELTKLITPKNSTDIPDFYIGFSRPVGNYLICEIWHKRFGESYAIRFGESLKVLFIFSNNEISKVFFKPVFR